MSTLPAEEKVTGPVAELIEKARKWPREGFGEGQLFNDLADEAERLWRALKMIADETVCPELWRPKQRQDWSDNELAYKTALVIATAAIEGKANGK
jgi:hypothetical protein